MSESRIYFYPLWLRLWHLLNAVCIVVLIISGFMMHWGIHGNVLTFPLIVKLHNYTGIILSLNYIVFFTGNIVFDNSRYYNLKLKGWHRRIFRQAIYYAFGMFRNQQPPFPLNEKRKFNPLQKYSYFFVMYLMLPLVIISGIGLLFPELIVNEIYSVNGVFLTAIFHAALGFLISIFLIVHIYAASIGKSPLANYRSIVTGWHELSH